KSKLPAKEKTTAALLEVLDDGSKLQATLTAATIGAAALALGIFVAITIVERAFFEIKSGRQLSETRGRKLFLINFWFLFPIAAVASIAAISFRSDVLPQIFGVIPIFALWVTVITVLATAGTRFHQVYRVPIVSLVIIVVLLFEFFGLSDNHKFRQIDKVVTRANIDDAFSQWIASRKDADAYRGKKPYPVYIVAAEGGGMYAAYHAAKLLARIQDLCDNFAQHAFAISGVSGGSLGGAIFTALAQERAANGPHKPCSEKYVRKEGGFEDSADHLLAHDFLSPLIWAGLFRDFAQRFLPIPIYQLDRAVALEKSFEDAWDLHKPKGKNPFRESFFSLCSPGSRTCPPEAVTAPALLLNTTNVETGMQMVLSPLYLRYTAYSQTGIIEDFYRKSADMPELPLSTAVGLSARFPWILPTGWHEFTLPADSSDTKS